MIREIISYELSEGTQFDNYPDCERYEMSCILKVVSESSIYPKRVLTE